MGLGNFFYHRAYTVVLPQSVLLGGTKRIREADEGSEIGYYTKSLYPFGDFFDLLKATTGVEISLHARGVVTGVCGELRKNAIASMGRRARREADYRGILEESLVIEDGTLVRAILDNGTGIDESLRRRLGKERIEKPRGMNSQNGHDGVGVLDAVQSLQDIDPHAILHIANRGDIQGAGAVFTMSLEALCNYQQPQDVGGSKG